MKYLIAIIVCVFYFSNPLSSQNTRIVASFMDYNGDFLMGDGDLVLGQPEFVTIQRHSGGIQNNTDIDTRFSNYRIGRASFYLTAMNLPVGTTYTPLLMHAFTGQPLREVVVEYRDFDLDTAGAVKRRFTLSDVAVVKCIMKDGEQATFELELSASRILEEYWVVNDDSTLGNKTEFQWDQIINKQQ